MAIYIFIAFIIILLNCYEHSPKRLNQEVADRRICFICSFLLVVLAALRATGVGTDTPGYVRDYQIVKYYSYRQLLLRYYDNPGYYILSKVFADLGVSIQIWFGIVEFIYISAVHKIINTFSKDKAFSYLMFMILGCYSFSLSGLKQTIAMGLVLWGFYFLSQRKYIYYAVLIALGFFFHKTCLVMIFAFLIMKIKDSRRLYFLMMLGFIVFMIGYDRIARSSITFLGDEHYSLYLKSDNTYSATSFIVYLVLFVLSFLEFKKYNNNNIEETRIVMGMSYLGLIALPLAFSIASAFRISLYFAVFLDIFLPNCLSGVNYRYNRIILKIFTIGALLFYFVYINRNGGGIVPYRFYWNL